jgi:predicted aspartyl protease
MIKKLFNKLFKKIEKISFKEAMDLTEMPIITLYQGEKKFNFLLDTGSNNSIIDSNILDQIERKIINERSSLFGMEGNVKEVSMCKIVLSYKDKEYEYKYLIQDMKAPFDNIKNSTGVTLHGIIGSNFFNEYKYVLDFSELVAYSKV